MYRRGKERSCGGGEEKGDEIAMSVYHGDEDGLGRCDPREMISIYSINDARNDGDAGEYGGGGQRCGCMRVLAEPQLINTRVRSPDFAGYDHVEDEAKTDKMETPSVADNSCAI